MNTECHTHKTPSYTLTCRMSHEAAALERLCQVVRIRGFRIARMAVESVLEGADETLEIALTIQEPGRWPCFGHNLRSCIP